MLGGMKRTARPRHGAVWGGVSVSPGRCNVIQVRHGGPNHQVHRGNQSAMWGVWGGVWVTGRYGGWAPTQTVGQGLNAKGVTVVTMYNNNVMCGVNAYWVSRLVWWNVAMLWVNGVGCQSVGSR